MIRELVVNKPEARDVVYLEELGYKHDVIIAYETEGSNGNRRGLAILHDLPGGDKAGFLYHKSLVKDFQCQIHHAKYLAQTREAAIKKASFGGRLILVFDTFSEFLAHAATLDLKRR